jgi:hypothetical protein
MLITNVFSYKAATTKLRYFSAIRFLMAYVNLNTIAKI